MITNITTIGTPKKIAGVGNSTPVARVEERIYWPRTLRDTPDGVVGGFQETARYHFHGPTGGQLGAEGRDVGPYYAGPIYTQLDPWVYRRG